MRTLTLVILNGLKLGQEVVQNTVGVIPGQVEQFFIRILIVLNINLLHALVKVETERWENVRSTLRSCWWSWASSVAELINYTVSQKSSHF